jgi:hypothetical protein
VSALSLLFPLCYSNIQFDYRFSLAAFVIFFPLEDLFIRSYQAASVFIPLAASSEGEAQLRTSVTRRPSLVEYGKRHAILVPLLTPLSPPLHKPRLRRTILLSIRRHRAPQFCHPGHDQRVLDLKLCGPRRPRHVVRVFDQAICATYVQTKTILLPSPFTFSRVAND